MTGDEAGWLDRPDLPDRFERWEEILPAGASRPTSAEEWAGALVSVRSGTLEVDCTAGGLERFRAGDLLALGWLPIVRMRSVGDGPVHLVAVRRRGDLPREAYLHVTRITDEDPPSA